MRLCSLGDVGVGADCDVAGAVLTGQFMLSCQGEKKLNLVEMGRLLKIGMTPS